MDEELKMYKVVEKRECKNCILNLNQFCVWGKSKKNKKIVEPKNKNRTKQKCNLITR